MASCVLLSAGLSRHSLQVRLICRSKRSFIAPNFSHLKFKFNVSTLIDVTGRQIVFD